MSCVTSVSKSTDVCIGRNYKIEVISQCMLVLRFLAIFQCGFAVFAEISCGFAVSGTPLTPPPYLVPISEKCGPYLFAPY